MPIPVPVQPGGDQRDEDVLAKRLAEARPEDDVRVVVGMLADLVGREPDLAQSEVGWAGNVEQDPARARELGLEQRAGDRLTSGVGRAVLAAAPTHADERGPGVLHDRPDVGEVEVDQARAP